MPARTNDFQKLVKVINHHLAPSGAKITESAMIYDAEAETKREVDILVESTLLNCEIKIGIECTAVGKALDIKAVEAFREKHRKLGINQTIVVSKNGFSNTAKKYGKTNNIKLLTFNSARTENWSKAFERLKGLSVYGRNYSLRSLSVKMNLEKAEPGFQFDQSVFVMDCGSWIPLFEFAKKLFIASEVSKHACKELKANEEKASDPWVEIGFNLEGKIDFKDQSGRIAKPDELVIVMGYRSKYRDLSSRQVSYDGQEMVVGGYFDKGSKDYAHVAINETDGQLVGTLEASESFFPPIENERK